ncbi:hypothetical protein E1B28_003513 [Marasmius oreades]|uniref:Uncharacterized protein n=1 Tax=Marasmius oreades TaxID=181124 RepID=A0A9P7RMR7_9AGAR|nr:uncharacterized protein E1B28_003513 [Marasmius oreades]KAG7085990.1 hypothetical protein E1B28_003513 [Marasmius oreades]
MVEIAVGTLDMDATLILAKSKEVTEGATMEDMSIVVRGKSLELVTVVMDVVATAIEPGDSLTPYLWFLFLFSSFGNPPCFSLSMAVFRQVLTNCTVPLNVIQ